MFTSWKAKSPFYMTKGLGFLLLGICLLHLIVTDTYKLYIAARYEYILLADKNDSDRDAELLAEYLRYKQAGVNLIPANPVPEKGYFRPGTKRVERFLSILHRRRIHATVRKEMGKDINAACGQLRAAFAGEKAQGTRS